MLGVVLEREGPTWCEPHYNPLKHVLQRLRCSLDSHHVARHVLEGGGEVEASAELDGGSLGLLGGNCGGEGRIFKKPCLT